MIKEVNIRKSSNEKIKIARVKKIITPEAGLLSNIDFDGLKLMKI